MSFVGTRPEVTKYVKKYTKEMRARKGIKQNYYLTGREWPYKNVPRRIIAEKYMVDESGYELKDYKDWYIHPRHFISMTPMIANFAFSQMHWKVYLIEKLIYIFWKENFHLNRKKKIEFFIRIILKGRCK